MSLKSKIPGKYWFEKNIENMISEAKLEEKFNTFVRKI